MKRALLVQCCMRTSYWEFSHLQFVVGISICLKASWSHQQSQLFCCCCFFQLILVKFLDHTEKISDFNHNFSLAFTFLFSFTWRRRRKGWPGKKSFHGRDLGQSSNEGETTKQVSSCFKRDVVCMSYIKSVYSLSMDPNIEYAQYGVSPGRFFLPCNQQIVFWIPKILRSFLTRKNTLTWRMKTIFPVWRKTAKITLFKSMKRKNVKWYSYKLTKCDSICIWND